MNKYLALPALALLLSACASDPVIRPLNVSERTAFMLQQAGTERPSFPLARSYDTMAEQYSVDGGPYTCNGTHTLTTHKNLEIRQLDGNAFEGTETYAQNCASGAFRQESISGRYTKDHVYLTWTISEPGSTGWVNRYSIKNNALYYDGRFRMVDGQIRWQEAVTDGETTGGNSYKVQPYVPVPYRKERVAELRQLASDYQQLAAETRAEWQAEQREESARTAAAFNAFVGTLASEMAKNNAQIAANNASLQDARNNMLASQQRREAIARAEQANRERMARGLASGALPSDALPPVQQPVVARADTSRQPASGAKKPSRPSSAANVQQASVAAAPAKPATRLAGATGPAASAVSPASSATTPARARADDGVRRQAYLEAVLVCTKPSGPKQAFDCLSPVTKLHGHLEDISGSRTPDEVARGSASCTEKRPLASSTHLVWGCGFAATGGVNALDRSAGVDIKGRRTYYCTERQLGCRRTEP